ncbi:hypothetical protein BGX26_009321 [Mortierella sp. AD094]|nr:hypothetical protein BGX26_009321 [Mortierella sp. AD094]
MSQPTSTGQDVPKVLIVGAGIGGLTLAILLEQINIPYHIFERASEVKPLGSAMSFTGGIFPALEQLSIYEELKQVSKAYTDIEFYDAKLKKLGSIDVEENNVVTGYENLIFSRPKFYEILRKRVPEHNISFKKKIVKTEEMDDKVYIYCSDDTTYSGDILVGADGAYSGVRQNLYKLLDEKGILPKQDLEDFSINYVTIVGVATPPNPEKYPKLNDNYSSFNQVLYGDGGNCYVITLPDNQISWGFGIQITEADVKKLKSQNVGWGPDANDATLTKYRDFPCPLGGTMGELFDATPKDLISKVFLEEKMFKTCHYGRIVLLGDGNEISTSWHKFHPAGGQGAQNALYDAVSLANCLHSMNNYRLKNVSSAFEEYYKQRYHHNEAKFKDSAMLSKILNGQKPLERLIRNLILKFLTNWTLKSQIWKELAYRPQIAWLPLIENRGKGPILPQEFSEAIAVSAVGV